MSWQLQEAKQKFSELVRRAQRDGPQLVTRHGEEVVVVLDAAEFRRMAGVPDFRVFLESIPLEGELEIARDRRPAPEFEP